MALTPGTRLGPYEVVAQIGVGGMGEVYKATDTNLKRNVAIKVLPASVAGDAERLARFQREAEVLAAFNHPNIAQIHGLEKSDGTIALVMELVEGPTLEDRLAPAPGLPASGLPLEDALPIARQICEALEAAHERGIIHRDLKPANIKVRGDGTVKVLDFGLAKLVEAGGAGTTGGAGRVGGLLTNSPTLSLQATQAGMILGTAAYMSPEQARGRDVDTRADIWAFGAVLFEMLTGMRAFPGEDLTDTLAAVVKLDPAWDALPADVPPRVRHVLRVCLQKDPRQRAHAIGDVRLALEGAFETSAPQATTTAAAPGGRVVWTIALAVAGVLAAALTIAAVRYLRQAPITVPELRLEMVTPPTTDSVSIAISPDGRQMAFVATAQGGSRLWLRPLDALRPRALERTEGATSPFWSPDSQSIGFFADGKVKQIDVASGAVQAVADCRNCSGGAWGPDGTILVSSVSGPISKVSSSGGAMTPVTEVLGADQGHKLPRFLPDGRTFLYFVRGDDQTRGIYVSSLDGLAPHRLLDGDTAAPVFAVNGKLVFVRQGTLFEQPFDTERLELTGRPAPLAEEVGVDANSHAALTVSSSGVIAFRTAATTNRRQFTWYDRSGKVLGNVGDPDDRRSWSPRLSPDETTIAMHRTEDNNVDIWFLDARRGVFSRLTSDPASQLSPVWSPDGLRLAYNWFRPDGFEIHIKTLATGADKSLGRGSPMDWSPDGRTLLTNADNNLVALPVEGGTSQTVVPGARRGQFSPDGRWVAYESQESGQMEVYVQAFPQATSKIRVSTNGGAQARWSHDGRELFYIALDERLMAVPMRQAVGGGLEPQAPVPLFPTKVGGAVQDLTSALYMVSSDGKRFLMSTLLEDVSATPITLIVNRLPRP